MWNNFCYIYMQSLKGFLCQCCHFFYPHRNWWWLYTVTKKNEILLHKHDLIWPYCVQLQFSDEKNLRREKECILECQWENIIHFNKKSSPWINEMLPFFPCHHELINFIDFQKISIQHAALIITSAGLIEFMYNFLWVCFSYDETHAMCLAFFRFDH